MIRKRRQRGSELRYGIETILHGWIRDQIDTELRIRMESRCYGLPTRSSTLKFALQIWLERARL